MLILFKVFVPRSNAKNSSSVTNVNSTPPQPTTAGLLSENHKLFLPKIHLHNVETAGRHPHWSYGRAYYIIYDHKIAYKIRVSMKKWERQLKVPPCDDIEKLIAEGLTYLEWGDALFFRISLADPAQDLLAICVAPEELIKPEIPRFDRAIELVIGPKEDCGPDRPKRVPVTDSEGRTRSEWQGGTIFERATARNGANKQGARCYANALTTETGTDILAPAANLSGEWDEALDRRKEINLVRNPSYSTTPLHPS